MESIPVHARGFVSGLLQSGYPTGYFMASIVYGVLFPYIGWRGMFMVGRDPGPVGVLYSAHRAGNRRAGAGKPRRSAVAL